MRFGIMIMARGPGGRAPGLTAMAQRAEAGGLDIIAINDHVVVPNGIASTYPYSEDGVWAGRAVGECLEMVTAASFIAAATNKIELLTSVMVVPYRPAVLAAKMLATLDVLSNGRLTVGCGAGWMQEEFAALGLPPFAGRGKVTDEYIAAFRTLWTDESPSMAGEYVQFSDITFEPKPLHQPRLPIWIGGEGGAAIRRAARAGDGWYPCSHNPAYPMDTPDRYAQGLARLNAAADKLGRSSADIHRAYLAVRPVIGKEQRDSDGNRRAFAGTPDAIRDDIGAFADAGVETIIFPSAGRDLSEILDRISWLTEDVLPGPRT
ncbi:MAG: TIGR03619 family F420-dependent LLM class oxidoreductase [Proteobacteria bacterium]|nr:TIGR03619 family F420-dependent LLM class oxidoreductase [Pseudomonadota bacterium]